jgi:hypothetical protein
MKMEQTGCSEMLAYKIQTLGDYPEQSIIKGKKVKQSRYRPGVAQRVPGSQGSQIT